MTKIMYVDDDVSYLNLVKMFLTHQGFSVVTLSNSLDALDTLKEQSDIDLVILDVMMPQIDGFELCQKIKDEFNLPILMLTALNDSVNEVYGIDIGADEYISKPFKHEIFIARINALLRRTKNQDKKTLLDEGVVLDEVACKVTAGGTEVTLTKKEITLLKYIILNKEQVLDREKILNNVWGWDYYGDPRTVDTHIKTLRGKLGDFGKSIVTVRGVGYSYRRSMK